ncbi:MAG: hypothetical protein Q9188_004151 [Gyalolechia gomerana]
MAQFTSNSNRNPPEYCENFPTSHAMPAKPTTPPKILDTPNLPTTPNFPTSPNHSDENHDNTTPEGENNTNDPSSPAKNLNQNPAKNSELIVFVDEDGKERIYRMIRTESRFEWWAGIIKMIFIILCESTARYSLLL